MVYDIVNDIIKVNYLGNRVIFETFIEVNTLFFDKFLDAVIESIE